jgi:hypothetical protein
MKPDSRRTGKLLQSGVIFSAISFLTLGIHWLFQFIVSPQLGGMDGEYGLVLTTIALITFLGLPLQIGSQVITHHIARFHFSGDDARLQGLLAGCRKFLLHLTIGGSLVAILLIRPLSVYFNIPRTSLTLIALGCTVVGLWGTYVTVLCQGLGWFKRLALIGLLSAVLRLLFGGLTTRIWPVAEYAVAASGVMVLANLVLFFWKKEFPRSAGNVISPWTPEFKQFLAVCCVWAAGSSCLNQGDLLVAGKFFSKSDLDAYGSASLFARALPTMVGPLLTVLFTHRSGYSQTREGMLGEQLKLVGLYTAGLIGGAVCLYVLRGFCLQLLHRNTPDARAMIGPLAMTMVFVGLLQALGTWALASRWSMVSVLYGMLGIGYWLVLLLTGKTPALLLHTMPVTAGIALAALLAAWLMTMRWHPTAPSEC